MCLFYLLYDHLKQQHSFYSKHLLNKASEIDEKKIELTEKKDEVEGKLKTIMEEKKTLVDKFKEEYKYVDFHIVIIVKLTYY